MKYKKGSNQYKKIKVINDRYGLSTGRLILLGTTSFIFCVLSSLIGQHTFNGDVDAPTHLKMLNPVSVVHAQEPVLSEHEQIINEIKLVFNNEAPKAFKLLSCENGKLNPFAINDNTKWGGVGRDIGIFQINTKWQGVSNEAFLRDWRINIRIAWNIYSRDGYSFKLWTCGRKIGI